MAALAFDDGDRAVGDEQIEESVGVVVEPGRAEAGEGEAAHGETEALCGVFEESVAVVAVEGVGFAGEVRHEQVVVAVLIEVGGGDAHACLGSSVGVEGRAGGKGGVLEATLALVDPKLVGIAVVGDVDVDEVVAVEVGGGDAESAAEGLVDAGLGCGIGEAAVTVVAEKAVGDGIVERGVAVVARAGGFAAFAVLADGEVDVVGVEEVEVAVVVIVDKGGAGAPAVVGGSPLWAVTSVKVPSPLAR